LANNAHVEKSDAIDAQDFLSLKIPCKSGLVDQIRLALAFEEITTTLAAVCTLKAACNVS
jgi:hypothetical protein